MQQPIEIVALLDKSGSMSALRDDAIGGFNTFLAEQQLDTAPANLTLIQFDNEYEVYYDRIALADAKPLDRETYVPRGNTALNDALGRALVQLETWSPDKAIIVITTDGAENASKEFTLAQVKDKIEAAQARGWQVVFLAANQDAFAEGSARGILAQNTANYEATGVGLRGALNNASTTVASYRSS